MVAGKERRAVLELAVCVQVHTTSDRPISLAIHLSRTGCTFHARCLRLESLGPQGGQTQGIGVGGQRTWDAGGAVVWIVVWLVVWVMSLEDQLIVGEWSYCDLRGLEPLCYYS